jgi:hypothetical protein
MTMAARREVTGRKSGTEQPTELDAFSIDEFCRRHSISRGTYYNLKADDKGPKEARAMGRVLITKESAAEWRRERETETETA